LIDAAKIVILNDNFSGIDAFDKALIILYRRVNENYLIVHNGFCFDDLVSVLAMLDTIILTVYLVGTTKFRCRLLCSLRQKSTVEFNILWHQQLNAVDCWSN
jgi:hypothetical protein